MGVTSSIVCHDAGSPKERQDMADAVEGRAIFTPLYWWNKKIRTALWKRPLLELRQLLKTGFIRRSTALVAEFCRRQQISLIHSNTFVTLEGGYAAKAMSLPHVWHVRELIGQSHPFQFWPKGSAFTSFVTHLADALVANSHATANAIRDLIPPERLHVIPNGIDLRAFKPRKQSSSDRLVVAMVANLTSRWKNHRQFVEAAIQVNPTLPVEFRIYGHDQSAGGKIAGDPYVDELHRLIAAAGQQDRFKWPGFIDRPEQIMSEIDILVHSADQESFGRIVVEGMASGLPVVGVSAGGVGEIVVDGQTGWLVTPGAASEMARKIEHLIQNPDVRASFAAAGRARAESEYSIEICAARIFEIYRGLTSCASKHPTSLAHKRIDSNR